VSERAAEAVAYAVAASALVTFGTLWPDYVLNWFVGPLLIVVTVTVLTPLLARWRRR